MRGIHKILWALPLLMLTNSVLVAAPVNWQFGFQEAVTPVMEELNAFHNILLAIEGTVGVIVLALLIFIIFRFCAKRNPVASKTSHNTILEVIWTTIPVLILVVIVFPSMRLLYFMDVEPEAELTIKATGYQWYWGYEYPDQNISFDSIILEDSELKPGDVRLFSVDNNVVVPVNTTVRLITTAADVIHSWAIPAFGVKRDSIPGRLNEAWFKVTKEGRYYGQCSELCGAKHGFMPIVVDVVSKAKFNHWVALQKAGDAPAAILPVNGEVK